jgi:capsular polysaccharide biosynthesis protein
MQLYEYVQVLRAWWWVIALATATAAVVAYLYGASQTPTYRSTVRLEVTSRPDYGQVMAVERTLNQLTARVTTMSVATAVDERLGLGLGAGAVLGRVRAQAVPSAMQIQLEVEDTTPGRAEQIARGFAEVVQERQTTAMSGVPEYQRVLVTPLDPPTAARQVWPPTRSFVAAGALLGLMSGTVLAFVADHVSSLKVRQEAAR